MRVSSAYDALAGAYDALAYDMETEDWTEYLLSFLHGRRMRILEYGCGTGRITEGLLKAGHFVIGLDRSEEMLGAAARRLRPLGRRFELVAGDMRNFHLEKPADAVVSACDCVNYLIDPGELRSFFLGAFSNLKAGGVLLFDISSSHKIEHVLGNEFFFDDSEDQTLLWQNEFDPGSRLLRMSLSLFTRCGDGRYERSDEEHVQRAWEADEIVCELRSCGFSQIRVFEFGTEDPLSRPGDRIQFAARKGEKNE